MTLTFFIFVLCCGVNLCLAEDNPLVVETPLGKVRGFWKTTLKGRRHAAFEGIPYALPPVGDLRFEKPRPMKPWSDILESKTPQECPQYNPVEAKGEEDCLYLNVYTPVDLKGIIKKLDVIVAIHGGGFVVGSHMMTESNFILDKDIVLVTINYRLGIFGFLATEDNVIPGNFGLKDQVLALKWVKDNIEAFGGNPNSITIVGLSAGGVSVHLHYFSPLSEGLFHRGLSQSGTALVPWAIKEKPLENAKKLAVLVGCPDTPSEELKHCLKNQTTQNLMSQMKHFYGYGAMLPFTPFGPVVEKGSDEPFLVREPYGLLREGKVFDVPWITSSAADDGLLPGAFFWERFDEVNEKWDDLAHYMLDYNYTLPKSKRVSVAREIFDHYLGAGENLNKNNYKKFVQIFTDRLFAVPGELSAKMQAKVTKSSVYYYFFSYKEGVNKAVNFYSQHSIEGAAHAEDSIYFYGLFASKPLSDQDARLKDQCIEMLHSFASTGIPSFDGTNNWKPTGSSELTYLNVSGPNNFKLETVENFTPIEFWSKLGLVENENFIVKDEL